MLVATLIGDVVRSRRAADRGDLHERLRGALEDVNASLHPVTPLRITVGDEYQGAFASVPAALRASLRLRLAMLPDQDARHGISWGEVSVLEEEPRVEDGPGWWTARDALKVVQDAEGRPASRWRRTAYRAARSSGGPDPALVESALILRDAQVGGLSGRSVSVLRGLLDGRTQREIAAELGVTASAVSQRVRADALAALVAADHELEEDPR